MKDLAGADTAPLHWFYGVGLQKNISPTMLNHRVLDRASTAVLWFGVT